jgi:hypothetical protein
LRSNPREEAGAHAPAFLPLVRFRWFRTTRIRFLLRAAVVTLVAWMAWMGCAGIGERFAKARLQRSMSDLPQIESLTRQVATSLGADGVCRDMPAIPAGARADFPSHVALLRSLMGIQSSCIDLALAHNELLTLHVARATLQRIAQRQLRAGGLLNDSVMYRSNKFYRQR